MSLKATFLFKNDLCFPYTVLDNVTAHISFIELLLIKLSGLRSF